MINREAAEQIAMAEIAQHHPPKDDEIVLLENLTIERPFGWVFFYSTRRYQETNDMADMLVGNAPMIVDRRNGSLHYTGTAEPIERYIEEYEKQRGDDLRQPRPDSIGAATMRLDRTIVLRLFAELPDGSGHGEAMFTYPPSDKNYTAVLTHLGGLRPGESKQVPPWP